jgi:hypothetical protein
MIIISSSFLLLTDYDELTGRRPLKARLDVVEEHYFNTTNKEMS